MSINLPPYTAVSDTAVAIGTVPPGVSTVIISNTGENPVTIGTSSGVTASNGFPIPAGTTITIPGYPGSSGTALYAIAATGTNNVGIVISTAS